MAAAHLFFSSQRGGRAQLTAGDEPLAVMVPGDATAESPPPRGRVTG